MKYECIGFLELATIAKGIEVTDALFKKATVNLIFAYPVSPGKYLTCFGGEVEEVRSSLRTGKEIAKGSLIGSFTIPNLHEDISLAFNKKIEIKDIEALGIFETVTCANCILAADAALKTSKVQLIKLHLGKGIGGKGCFVITGEVEDVESSMLAAVRVIKKQGIVEKIVIPNASTELSAIFGVTGANF